MHRTLPDSDMARSPTEFDRLREELGQYCKHVHAQPSFAFRRIIRWVLTRMRIPSCFFPEDKRKERESSLAINAKTHRSEVRTVSTLRYGGGNSGRAADTRVAADRGGCTRRLDAVRRSLGFAGGDLNARGSVHNTDRL